MKTINNNYGGACFYSATLFRAATKVQANDNGHALRINGQVTEKSQQLFFT
jgi:hypothetical protein